MQKEADMQAHDKKGNCVLVKLKDAHNHVPFKEKTLRNWRSQGKYPSMFQKWGGTVFINLEEFWKIFHLKTKEARRAAKILEE